MNKQFLLLLAAIALMPGCLFRSKKAEKRPVDHREVMTDVDIPVAEDGIKDFFDQDLEKMALADGDDAQYAWIEAGKNSNGFKKVYFDFDKYGIKATEKESVAQDVARMKEMLAQNQDVTFVINGNADHAAGSASYNRILSEKRAKALKDQAVAAGVPSSKIKIVGRGFDVPEVINGKPCSGDKDAQWLNRRDEIQVVARAA